MTFPAWDAFDGDERVKVRHLRVYRWCRKNLNFLEPIAPKLETITSQTRVDKADVSRVLDSLVAWGYLTEHARGTYRERAFTLVWALVVKTPTSGPAATGDVAA